MDQARITRGHGLGRPMHLVVSSAYLARNLGGSNLFHAGRSVLPGEGCSNVQQFTLQLGTGDHRGEDGLSESALRACRFSSCAPADKFECAAPDSLSICTSQIPYILVQAVLFTCISYYLIGGKTDEICLMQRRQVRVLHPVDLHRGSQLLLFASRIRTRSRQVLLLHVRLLPGPHPLHGGSSSRCRHSLLPAHRRTAVARKGSWAVQPDATTCTMQKPSDQSVLQVFGQFLVYLTPSIQMAQIMASGATPPAPLAPDDPFRKSD